MRKSFDSLFRCSVAMLLLIPAIAVGQQGVQIRMASWKPGPAPIVYPILLASGDVVGVVDVQFVVDPTGHVDMSSLKVLKSSHDLFTRSATDAIADGGATGALVNGAPRSQVMLHRFVFAPASERACEDTSPQMAPLVTLVCAPTDGKRPRNDEKPGCTPVPFKPDGRPCPRRRD